MSTAGRLTASEARRMALRAQGLLGAGARPRRPAAVLRLVAALQLDTISVLARSHELACYARAGPVGRASVDRAIWGSDRSGDAVAFEYWAHAACILPIEAWPSFAFRRREMARRMARWLRATPEALAEVRRRLADEGPLTASELGGAKLGGTWWDWSPLKVAVERLLDIGEVACTTRRGWRRVYDLASRAIPPGILAAGEPDDHDCHRGLVALAGRCLGVATTADLAEYFHLKREPIRRVVADSGLVAVAVEGWAEPAWADPSALAALSVRGRHRTTLLSPFDSLVWNRSRDERLWGYTHRLEAYTPQAKRVHGYYVMPLLAGGRLIGRVDPKRVGRTLVARQVSLIEPVGEAGVTALAAALVEAASWVGCDNVVVERASPESVATAIRRLV